MFYDTEVQWENIALNKPAYSSSVYASIEAGPSKAVDGNTDLDGNVGSCFHSSTADSEPWWLVNLGQPAMISWVRLTNRGDCCCK